MSRSFLEATGLHEVQRALSDLTEQIESTDVWIIGSPVQYSIHVELGTQNMAAQPYLRRAVEDVMQNEADRIAREASSTDDLVAKLAHAIEAQARQNAPVDTGTLRRSIEAVKIR